jgi:hypothetical protein
VKAISVISKFIKNNLLSNCYHLIPKNTLLPRLVSNQRAAFSPNKKIKTSLCLYITINIQKIFFVADNFAFKPERLILL